MRMELRDMLIVAGHEWQDSRRSRRVWLIFILYLLGSLGACFLFAYVLGEIEAQVSETVGLSRTAKTGTMSSALIESDSFFEVVKGLIGDEELARKLVKTPPLILFYAWLSFTFTPILVVLLSSESISGDVSSGFARFNLFRISRLSWVVGKAAGQAGILLAALMLSALGAWIIGVFRMSHFQYIDSIPLLLEFSVKAWWYALTFLGAALAASQWTRSPTLSRSLGLLVVFLWSILAALANYYAGDGIARLWELVLILTPQGHRLDFFRPEIISVIKAATYTTGLGILYFLSGYAIFARRDI